jgi:hypothetical protein
MKSITRRFSVADLVLGFTGIAHGGVEPVRDHLQCYKVADPSRFSAILNMNIGFEAETWGLTDTSGCKAKLRAVKLCVPAAKTVVETDATVIPSVGQDLQNGFLCYKMKCAKGEAATLPAGDQFGIRDVSASSVLEVCTPVDY